jgi:hypothetical protein
MSQEILKHAVRNYIHEGKQFPEGSETALLTVHRVGRPASRGALDFGGSEYRPAEVEWIEPVKQSADDTYGWWQLDEGHYLVEFNETLQATERQRFYLQTWEAVVATGTFHPFTLLYGPKEGLRVLISVGPGGLNIKENARFSELGVLDR